MNHDWFSTRIICFFFNAVFLNGHGIRDVSGKESIGASLYFEKSFIILSFKPIMF
jgi:hypothetical protein